MKKKVQFISLRSKRQPCSSGKSRDQTVGCLVNKFKRMTANDNEIRQIFLFIETTYYAITTYGSHMYVVQVWVGLYGIKKATKQHRDYVYVYDSSKKIKTNQWDQILLYFTGPLGEHASISAYFWIFFSFLWKKICI